MSFFSKLFGSKKQNQQTSHDRSHQQKAAEEPAKGNPFFTNAPSHWPIITDEFLSSNVTFTHKFDHNKEEAVFNKRLYMVNSMALLGAVNKGLTDNIGTKVLSSYSGGFFDSKEQYATTFCVEKLSSKGIIKTNGIVIDNFEKYAVFLFEKPTSAAYHQELRSLFAEDGFKDVIYYSQTDPETVEQTGEIVLPFEGLNDSCFRMNPEKQKSTDRSYETYAMWWSGNSDASFMDSSAFNSISSYYNSCADCYSYILGKLGYALGLNKDDSRIALPDYDEVLISGPEDAEILMTLSKTSGINFHFPTMQKSEKYRDNFLKVFATFAESLKKEIENNNFDKDPESVHPVWFEQVKNNPDADQISFISLILSDQVRTMLN